MQGSQSPPRYVYHCTSVGALKLIEEAGGLTNGGLSSASYVLETKSLENWAKPTRFFGSPIQGLLSGWFGRGHDQLALLRISVAPEEDDFYVRDLKSIFWHLNSKPYQSSIRNFQQFNFNEEKSIPEFIMRNKKSKIISWERMDIMHILPLSHFGSLELLRNYRLDPKNLLDLLFDSTANRIIPQRSIKNILPLNWHYRLLAFRTALQNALPSLSLRRQEPKQN